MNARAGVISARSNLIRRIHKFAQNLNRNRIPRWSILLLLLCGLPLVGTARQNWNAESILHRILDRTEAWRSLHAEFKVKVSIGDTTVVAKGRISYLAGERMEIAFRKPWNRFFGSFYFMPGTMIYWDDNISQMVLDSAAELDLASVIPLPFPDWDVRDMLPLVMSGREAGFMPDTVYIDDGNSRVSGSSGIVRHDLWLDDRIGGVTRECVQRVGRAAICKEYRKAKRIKGWMIPTRVVCTGADGRFSVDWSVSQIDLEAHEFIIPDSRQSTSPIIRVR